MLGIGLVGGCPIIVGLKTEGMVKGELKRSVLTTTHSSCMFPVTQGILGPTRLETTLHDHEKF